MSGSGRTSDRWRGGRKDLQVGLLPGTFAKAAGFSPWYKYLRTACRPPRGPQRGDHFARRLSDRCPSVPGGRTDLADHSLVAARGVVHRVLPRRPLGVSRCAPPRHARPLLVPRGVRRADRRVRRLPDPSPRAGDLNPPGSRKLGPVRTLHQKARRRSSAGQNV